MVRALSSNSHRRQQHRQREKCLQAAAAAREFAWQWSLPGTQRLPLAVSGAWGCPPHASRARFVLSFFFSARTRRGQIVTLSLMSRRGLVATPVLAGPTF
eukprot:m.113807 g.113807  ORF g.113807 m.113807 type:complete len:100 (-) comp9429_c0_seq5:35-334(-)